MCGSTALRLRLEGMALFYTSTRASTPADSVASPAVTFSSCVVPATVLVRRRVRAGHRHRAGALASPGQRRPTVGLPGGGRLGTMGKLVYGKVEKVLDLIQGGADLSADLEPIMEPWFLQDNHALKPDTNFSQAVGSSCPSLRTRLLQHIEIRCATMCGAHDDHGAPPCSTLAMQHTLDRWSSRSSACRGQAVKESGNPAPWMFSTSHEARTAHLADFGIDAYRGPWPSDPCYGCGGCWRHELHPPWFQQWLDAAAGESAENGSHWNSTWRLAIDRVASHPDFLR